MKRANPFPTGDHEFGLCLTHDLDRPYKGLQSLFYAVTEGNAAHLESLHPGVNPWWQFEEIMDLEADLGVRSAFYVLTAQHVLRDRPVREWLQPQHWIEHVGRYDPTDPEIASVLRDLDENGWEVGLHGSLGTHEDPGRLADEKEIVERILGHEIIGGRQHHLRLSVPRSWLYHADAGLVYDATLGSTENLGFDYGYDLLRPFDDSFVVFPLTVMDKALMRETTDVDTASARLSALLADARENNAVMTVLWHPRNFSTTDFPGQRELYRGLVEEALATGGWVGPPRDLYRKLSTAEPAQLGEAGRTDDDD